MTERTILIVDDASESIYLLRGLLEDKFKIKAAINGEKALQIAEADPPSLILLDVMMPGMDGYEVCRRLKASSATRRIPVVFLSAKISREEQQQGIDMGAIGYLTKPVDPQMLMDTLDLVFF